MKLRSRSTGILSGAVLNDRKGTFCKRSSFLLFQLRPNACEISDCDISAQIDVLNHDFAGTGLKFELASVSRTTNWLWFNLLAPHNGFERDAKTTLRVGGVADLNVYTSGWVAL